MIYIHCSELILLFYASFLIILVHFFNFNCNDIILKKVGDILLITNEDIKRTIGIKIKQARLSQKYTQEYVAENIEISTDLLRNIENGRNIGSLPTLLNICNFLRISPNTLFEELLNFKEDTLDSSLTNYFNSFSNKDINTLKEIIIHLDKNYTKKSQ